MINYHLGNTTIVLTISSILQADSHILNAHNFGLSKTTLHICCTMTFPLREVSKHRKLFLHGSGIKKLKSNIIKGGDGESKDE
jgi:hypothetical protein